MTDPTDYSAVLKPQEDNKPNEKMQMLSELVKQNYSTDNIAVKTELNEKQIKALSIGMLFADRYNNSLVKNLIDNIFKLSISKGRKSRKEYTEIAKSMLGSTDLGSNDNNESLTTRLFGGK